MVFSSRLLRWKDPGDHRCESFLWFDSDWLFVRGFAKTSKHGAVDNCFRSRINFCLHDEQQFKPVMKNDIVTTRRMLLGPNQTDHGTCL